MDYNEKQDKRIERVEQRFLDLSEYYNHQISEVNKSIGKVENNMAEIRTDVCWLKRFFWIIATASIASLVGQLINLIL